MAAMTRAEVVEAGLGMMYIVLTLCLSAYYLTLLLPIMTNDLWWAGFNSTGAQSYVMDLFNFHLSLGGHGPINLTDVSSGLPKDYSTFTSPIEIPPTYTRLLLHTNSRNISGIITTLRGLLGPEEVDTQYCWVDFNRTWEVAHTRLRQLRCQARYKDNAAVYWETAMRLVNWDVWIAFREDEFNFTMGNALGKAAEGTEWIRRTKNAYTDLSTEVAVWQRARVTYFLPQYTNNYGWGVTETIVIQNAVGIGQSISVKRLADKGVLMTWSTILLQWGPGNDLYIGSYFGYSSIRSDPGHQQFTYPCDYADYAADPAAYECDPCYAPWNPDPGYCWPDVETMLALPDVPVVQMVRANIGPFGSIDAYFVPPPPALTKVYASLHAVVMTAVLDSNDSIYDALQAVPSGRLDPVPPAWSGDAYMFMGGDPTCTTRQPQPFVQSSYSFNVACSSQVRLTTVVTGLAAVHAVVAASIDSTSFSPTVSCALCPTLAAECLDVLVPSMDVARTLLHHSTRDLLLDQVLAARDEIATLGVGTMQFAIHVVNASNALLFQPALIATSSSAWNVFGWMSLLEWAGGTREVVSFEGDRGTVVLLSDVYAPIMNEAMSMEVPRSACYFLLVVSVVVTGVLSTVGALMGAYALVVRGRVVGRNLFCFNRVAGAVWVGRPLLVVRGMTAIFLLSTSPLAFIRQSGLSRFVFSPRSMLDTAVVSGEALWISYVVADCLLVVTSTARHPHFAHASAAIGWLAYVCIEGAFPFQATAEFDRRCTMDVVRRSFLCTSGSIHVGQLRRVLLLGGIQVVCVVGALLAATLCRSWQPCTRDRSTGHLLLSGAANAFLSKDVLPNKAWLVDRASCVMCGLLTFREYGFDVKLWLFIADSNAAASSAVKWGKKVFEPPDLNVALRPADAPLSQPTNPPMPVKPRLRLFVLIGALYVVATILGSVTYLSLTATNMANDLWWADYSALREHNYIARLYNHHLLLRPHLGPITMDDTRFSDGANYNDTSLTGVKMSSLYASQVVASDGTDLAMAARGLRSMDGCFAPWIATQYCWLDFGMTWEMANSARRQARCRQNYTANGAVYLESVLRNVDWDRFHLCWESSLAHGLVAPLSQTTRGVAWWQAVQATTTTVAEEVEHWRTYGVAAFTTDWQNFKTLGILDSFNVENAFGVSYTMTLKHTNGSFHATSASSMKMYWSFASDLWAVAASSGAMRGASLIRGTSTFAFANTSLEDILAHNGTLPALFSQDATGLGTFRRTIGPFGSVDLKRVIAPPSLKVLVATMMDHISRKRVLSDAFDNEYRRLQAQIQTSYAPQSWEQSRFQLTTGGDLFCNDLPPTYVGISLYRFSGTSTGCDSNVGESLYPATMARLMAIVGAGYTRATSTVTMMPAMCDQFMVNFAPSCPKLLIEQPLSFVTNATLFPDTAFLEQLEAMAATAQADMHAMKIEIVQYGKEYLVSTELVLLRHEIFDPVYPAFHYIGWLLAYDWAMATREVISFQGDVDTVNVLTSATDTLASLTNSLEIPVNVATYIRYACVYVTSVIMVVAGLTMGYVVTNRGYVETTNLFELNRVAGLVWVGRTFLFVRSMAAICLLSTQVLFLRQHNSLWHFVSGSATANESPSEYALRHLKTLLAAGEVSWLVFVLNDFLVVLTQQYTTAYVVRCYYLVWGLSATLSLTFPATHSANLDRQCHYDHVDFQIVCSNGTIAIGSVSRFLVLVAICVGSVVVCYTYERIRQPHLPPPEQNSLFLSSAAKFVFNPEGWVDQEVYYIDQASAAINGILSMRLRGSIYMFDMKLWRLFVVDESMDTRQRLERQGSVHLLSAIPLTD